MAEKKRTAFEKALTDAALSRYETILEADPVPVKFSPAYRRAVADLTRKASRKTWRYVNTAAKRILIAALLLLLLAMTAVAAVPALREGLIRFFMRDIGPAYEFVFTEEDLARAPKQIETHYAPSYVPEGFTIVEEVYNSTKSLVSYLDEAGNVLTFDQHCLWRIEEGNPPGIATGISIDSEGSVAETAIMQGYEVTLFHIYEVPHGNEEINTVAVWTDHQYFYTIVGPVLSQSEIEKIIAGIHRVELQ